MPLLQVNSDVNEDYDSVNKEKIFDISMLNLEMIKKNLESVIPKLIILVRNPFIKNIRGSTDVLTGTVFVYESTIFKNDIGKSYDELINEKPNDCAIIVSFLLLHEIFMHKNLRANCNFLKGKETPSKFIGRGFTIKNFYYTTNKKNKDTSYGKELYAVQGLTLLLAPQSRSHSDKELVDLNTAGLGDEKVSQLMGGDQDSEYKKKYDYTNTHYK